MLRNDACKKFSKARHRSQSIFARTTRASERVLARFALGLGLADMMDRLMEREPAHNTVAHHRYIRISRCDRPPGGCV